MRLTFALATIALVTAANADKLTTCGKEVNVQAYALYDRTLKDLKPLGGFVDFAAANAFNGKSAGPPSPDSPTTEAVSTADATTSASKAETTTDAETTTKAESTTSTSSASSTSSTSSTSSASSTSSTSSASSTSSTSSSTASPKRNIRRLQAETTTEPAKSEPTTSTPPSSSTSSGDVSTTTTKPINMERSRALGVLSFASNDEKSEKCLGVEVPMPAAATDVDVTKLPKDEALGADKLTDSLNAIGHILSGGMKDNFDGAPTARLIYLMTEALPQSYLREADTDITPKIEVKKAAEKTKYDTEVTSWPEQTPDKSSACDAGFPKLETIDTLLGKTNATLVVVTSVPEWGPLVDLMMNARLVSVDPTKRMLAETADALYEKQMNNECQAALDRVKPDNNNTDGDKKKKFKWWHALLIVLGVAALVLVGALIYECTGRSRRHANDSEERAPAPAPLTGPSASRPLTAGMGAGTTAAAGSTGSLAARSGDLSAQQEAARRSGEEARNALDAARRSGSGTIKDGTASAAGATGAINAPAAGGSNGVENASSPIAGAKGSLESSTAAPNVGTKQAGSAPDNVAPGGIAALKERFNAD